MNRFRTVALATLAVALAAGASWAKAPAKDHTLVVHADSDGTNITIDETKHGHAKLDPGDRLVWELRCKGCPDGTQLEIEDIRHLAILDLLDNAEKSKVKKDAEDGKKVKPNYKDKDKDVYKVADAFRGSPERKTNKKIQSKPYLGFDHEHLWKFTWVIKVNGVEKDRWDPHFSGYRRNR